jgi:hypothetical protein
MHSELISFAYKKYSEYSEYFLVSVRRYGVIGETYSPVVIACCNGLKSFATLRPVPIYFLSELT